MVWFLKIKSELAQHRLGFWKCGDMTNCTYFGFLKYFFTVVYEYLPSNARLKNYIWIAPSGDLNKYILFGIAGA